MALGFVAACDKEVSYDDVNSPLSSAQVSAIDKQLVDFSIDCDNGMEDHNYTHEYKEAIFKVVGNEIECAVNITLNCEGEGWMKTRANVVLRNCKEPVEETQYSRICDGASKNPVGEDLVSSR